MADSIRIQGARAHNLKNLDLDLPRDRLVVITGLSGSGKSSLAFDTIYAEGQRRYVESLSAYARQFLGVMEKPDVDTIDGLSPAIAIEQKSGARNPRSTVGTVTEIYDYLRLLYARLGTQHCHKCGRPVTRQTADQIVAALLELPAGTRLQVLAPLVRGRKGQYKEVFAEARREGFVRVRVDGKVHDLDAVPALKKTQKHDIEVVVDRLTAEPKNRRRLGDSVETAWSWEAGWWPSSGTGAAKSGSGSSAATWRASPAGSRTRSSSPGCSRSTARTVRARRATGWGRGWRWIRSCSCWIRGSRSWRGS